MEIARLYMKVFNGQNVYGILRAVRTPGTEALVLSAPYRPEPFGENTLPGIALMLGVAKAFRSESSLY
jgi:GPI-anchor transamidase subunit GAA1